MLTYRLLAHPRFLKILKDVRKPKLEPVFDSVHLALSGFLHL